MNREDKEKSAIPFASGMGFERQFWVFVFGCVLGVVVEVLWCWLKTGTIESRSGLIYGPFNPVYGGGALLMTLALYRQRSGARIFLGSMVIGAAFEFLCSWVQELAFGTVSWEYSGSFLNLAGRTNLGFALAWGFLGLFYIRIVYPWFSRWLEKIPPHIGHALTVALALFLAFDIVISCAAVARQSARRRDIPAVSAMDAFLDAHYTDAYLKTIYPNMLVVARE